ncbi:MAG: nucleoside hydrolase [Dehalococcoidia bacterium]|nr:nucleoside hydrolase [Dehalococcoidia bacterium]
MKVHLDTDLGGDIDDICALALLLHWPGIEITGVTVVGDDKGKRTGYTRYALNIAGRNDIPVAAGADVSGGFYRCELGLPQENRYWPEPIPSSPNPPEEAIELLKKSIEQGAIIVGIGPYTNLYLLDTKYPGILKNAELFLMGGYIYPPRSGYPQWQRNLDFNVNIDIKSAKHVLGHSSPILIPLSVTVETSMRRSHLGRLRNAGKLGQLLARQAEAFAEDEKMEERFRKTCRGLPEDHINFQHDPLACAIALGYKDGVETKELPLILEEKDGWLHERIHDAGKIFRVVTRVDGPKFSEFWVNQVTK